MGLGNQGSLAEFRELAVSLRNQETRTRLMKIHWLILAGWLPFAGQAANWVRPGPDSNQPLWGLQGGLQFAIHPAGFRGRDGGPRGLIRLGYPMLTNGQYDLVNFIAIEPVVKGRKGFSELERSALDQVPGKRLWPTATTTGPAFETGTEAGKPARPIPGVEQLDVTLRVEKFENGAHVYLLLTQRSDAPDEIQLTIQAEPDSAPMDYCILTATMGNMARARQLWLRDQTATSTALYPEHRQTTFAPHTAFPLDKLQRTPQGDILVAITTDETEPAATVPFATRNFWYYAGSKVTQYWKKRNGTFRDDLQAVANARYTYWQSKQPIPGGIAFENFELRERFYEGQQLSFGITRRTPAELGFKVQ